MKKIEWNQAVLKEVKEYIHMIIFVVIVVFVVNNVVFPAIDLILAVFFFGKLGTAYFDYRKHGQFEWAAPAILFACLVFTLTAPTYIWTILGI